jgi:DNA-binding CsgD family transcriptional regulator
MERRAICLPARFDDLINNPCAALLESFYASLWNHEGFESFLAGLKDHAKSSSAALQVIPRDSGLMNWGWTVGIPTKFEQWYQENGDVDIHRLELLGAGVEGFIAASSFLNGVDFIDSVADTLKPWLREQAIVDIASLVIEYSDNEYLLLTLMRNEQEGKFKDSDICQLNSLASFIKRTAQLYVKLHRQQKTHDALIGAVRTLSQATIVVNEMLEVEHINPAAQFMLENFSSLAIINNKLVIDEPDLYAKLLSAVANLTANPVKKDLNSRVTLNIPQGKQAISITLTAVAGNIRVKKAKTVLLQIFHPNQPLLKAAYIQGFFNISQTEAFLCQLLVEGYTLKEIAQKREVSIHTIREQIRQIFSKTGFKRQAELVAGILRAAA